MSTHQSTTVTSKIQQHKSISKTQTGSIECSSRKSSISSDISSSIAVLSEGFDDQIIYEPKIEKISTETSTLAVKDEKTFEIKLEIQDYQIEEVSIKITKTLIKVEGKHESKFESRSFYKEFILTNGVNPENIKCTLSTNSILTISAPINLNQSEINSTTRMEQVTSTNNAMNVNQQQCQQTTKSINVQEKKTIQTGTTTEVNNKNINSSNKKLTEEVSSINTDTNDDEIIIRPTMDTTNKQTIVKSDKKTFVTTYEVKDYKVEEIIIKITKDYIKIEGKHKSEFASRSFYKELVIPDGVKPKTIKCTMNPNGILTFSAPINSNESPEDTEDVEDTETTSTKQQVSSVTSVKQQQQSIKSTTVKQQEKIQTTHSDSTNSINSNVSSIQEDTKKITEKECILKPTVDYDSNTVEDTNLEDISKEVRSIDDGKKFEMVLNVSEYKSEELKIKITKTLVIIKAKKVTEVSTKEISKKFSIPKGVNPETITSIRSPDGILTISAPIQPIQDQIVTDQQGQQTATITSTKEVHHTKVSSQTIQKEVNSNKDTSISSDVDTTTTDAISSNQTDDEIIIRPILETTTKKTNIEKISKNDEKNFEETYDAKDYKIEEITIRITKDFIKIEGKHKTELASKSFYKELVIPDGVKPETIKCTMSPNGVLTFSAPINPIESPDDTEDIEDTETTSTKQLSSVTSVKQQQQSIKSTTVKQQEKIQTTHSDNTNSINSNVSSIQEDTKKITEKECILKPTVDYDSNTVEDTNLEDISKEVRNIDDGKKFEMVLNVSEYKSEELKIKITKTLVIIKAKKVTETSTKEISKKFSIPKGVNPETITSIRSPDGILTISAPIQPIQDQIVTDQQGQQTATITSTKEVHHTKVSQTIQKEVNLNKDTSISSDVNSKTTDAISNKTDDDEIILRPILDTTTKKTTVEKTSKQVDNDEKNFEVTYDAKDYKIEEIIIKVTKDFIKIEGKHKTELASKSFYKEIVIPDGVKPETIKCTMSPNGLLTFSAPIDTTLNPEDDEEIEEIQDTESTCTQQEVSSFNVKQQKQSIKSTKVKQQEKTTTHSDSTNSINSNVSSIQEDTKKTTEEECILKPTVDYESPNTTDDTNLEDISKEIHITNDGKKFNITLNVSEYKSEELVIKITKTIVIIKGKKVTEHTTKEFVKKFSIPQGVNPDSITSTLTPKGILTISGSIKKTQELINTNTTSTTDNKINSVVSKTRQDEQQQVEVSQQQQQVEVSQQQQQQIISSRTTTVRTQQQSVEVSENLQSIENGTGTTRNISTISKTLKEDYTIQPIIDLNSHLIKNSSTHEDVSKQICKINDGNQFEIKLEVTEYKPEELQVKISDNMVIIEGKQINSSSTRSFYKKFSIPQGVKPENISTTLSSTGILKITAPIDQNENNTNTNGSSTTVSQCQTQQTSTSTSTSVTSSSVKQQKQQVNISKNSTSTLESTSGTDYILQPKIINSDALMTIDNTNLGDTSNENWNTNGSDGKELNMKLEVQEYRPEEIEVRISNNWVIIEGKQEMREENSFRSRSFCKKFTVPSGVKVENISCILNKNGQLRITAPIN